MNEFCKADIIKKFNISADSLDKIIKYLNISSEIKQCKSNKYVPFFSESDVQKIEDFLKIYPSSNDRHDFFKKLTNSSKGISAKAIEKELRITHHVFKVIINATNIHYNDKGFNYYTEEEKELIVKGLEDYKRKKEEEKNKPKKERVYIPKPRVKKELDEKLKSLYTSKQMYEKLNINNETLNRIIKYLNLIPIQKYHNLAHKICDFYTEEDFQKINQFLIDTPNKRALFLELSKIEKYGSLENFYKQKNEKSRKTKIERYGDPNYVNKEQIRKSHLKFWGDEEKKEDCIDRQKKTKLKKYGNENYNNTEKNKQTQIEHYGSVENAHKAGAIKSKETKLKKYDDENYVNVEKAQETKLKKYGDKGYHNFEQMKQTNLEKYGFEIPTQNKEVSAKISETWNNKSEEEIFNFIMKMENTKLERYGNRHYVNAEQASQTWQSKSDKEIEEIIQKRIQTNLEKYGVEYTSQDEKIKEKIKQSNIERFGTEYVLQNEEIKEKIKQTNLKNLGVEYPMQNKNIQNKVKETNLKKLEYAKSQNLLTSTNLSLLFKRDDSTITKVIHELNINPITFEKDSRIYISQSDLPLLEDYFAKTETSGVSYSEKQIIDFIKSICDYEVIENSRKIIPPLELDIFIPQKKLAIEFDGLYWHNENHKDSNYHINKTITCEQKGIDLIHVFEDDWIERQDIVKSMIASRLGVYQQKIFARKCKCEIFDYKFHKEKLQKFFDENHLQGFTWCDMFIGLTYENELVQCMAFKLEGFHDRNVELTRMATKLNTQVIGGFSKLMKFACKTYKFNSVTSYVNRAWFNGKGYLNSGFVIDKINKPSYYYVVNFHKIHKSHFRKDKIKKLYENKIFKYFDENETEHNLMYQNGIFRIYDCGTIKVVYKNPQLSI